MGFVNYDAHYYCELTKPAPPPSRPPRMAVAPQGGYGRFSSRFGPPTLTTPSSSYNPQVTWSLRTLKAAQVNLSTTAVGSATIALWDHAKYISQTVEPHAMNRVFLSINSRFHGAPNLPVFAGYVDEVHRIIDPTQGEVVELLCTSSYKLFEITSQTPGDVATLATAYMQNISGTQVLQMAAQACGFPSDMLVIDPTADSGSGIWQSISSGVFIDPDQQKWSAVLQSFLANSGLECFTDETGQLHWRPLGYLGPRSNPKGVVPLPRPVLEDEILHADLAESDRTAVTDVEVRYGIIPTTFGAPSWQAPAGMVTHLRQRRLIVHAPWIQTAAAAQYLATALGQMYAANLLVGSVTIPADPSFQLGTLCQVPTLRSDQTTGVYYISAVTYNLEWGGPWTMTLGLSYGRAPNQSFPYIGPIAQPILTAEAQQGFPQQGQNLLSYDNGNPAQVTNAFTVVANPTLANNVAVLDPNLGLTDGTVIYLRSARGKDIGPTPNGEYVTQSGLAGMGFIVDIKSTQNLGSDGLGYLTIRQGSPAGTTATQGAQSASTTQTAGTPALGTGRDPTNTSVTIPPPPSGTSLAIQALKAARTKLGYPYGIAQWGQGTPESYDCSGLVYWAYKAVGYNWPLSQKSPDNEYFWWLSHGGVDIPVTAAQPGDLLFIVEPQPWPAGSYWAGQRGFSHVAFCLTGDPSGTNLGGDSFALGVAVLRTDVFRSFQGTAFNKALNMSGATMISGGGP